MRNFILKACFFLFLIGNINQIQAQVTIGSTEAPEQGAILQLKEIVGAAPGDANSKKGLMLPKIHLERLNSLKPAADETVAGIPEQHIGLTIYNIADLGDGNICKGIYTWTADKLWARIPEPCLGIFPGYKVFKFYKSAPFPKSLPIVTSPEGMALTFEELPGGNIVWEPTGFPTTGTAGANNLFKPKANVSIPLVTLNSVIRAKATSPNGTTYTKDIPVELLDRDLRFTYPLSAMAAAGGALSLNVDAEVPWQTKAGDTPLTTMLTAFDGGVKPEGVSTYSFTLSANDNSFVDRSVGIGVTPLKDNLDFVPQSINIKQSGANPRMGSFNQTNWSLGAVTNTAGKLTFATNSNWKYTATGAFAKVLISPSAAAGVEVNGGTTPNTDKAQALSFTTSTNNDDEQGTVHTTTLTFTTTNHSTKTPVTQAVTIRRTVPITAGTDRISPAHASVVSRASSQVCVTTRANVNIAGVVWLGNGNATQISGRWASDWEGAKKGLQDRTACFPSQDNNTWAARNLFIHRQIGDAFTYLGSLSQRGYYLEPSGNYIIPSTLPHSGRVNCIAQTTVGESDAPTYRLRLRQGNTDLAYFGPYSGGGDKYFNFPANSSPADRNDIAIEVERPGHPSEVWKAIRTPVNQEGYAWTIGDHYVYKDRISIEVSYLALGGGNIDCNRHSQVLRDTGRQWTVLTWKEQRSIACEVRKSKSGGDFYTTAFAATINGQWQYARNTVYLNQFGNCASGEDGPGMIGGVLGDTKTPVYCISKK